MSKNIVILADGTLKDGGVGADSNVYRLFKALENRTSEQIVYYDTSIGSGGGCVGTMAAAMKKTRLQMPPLNAPLKWMTEHGAAAGLRLYDDAILSLPSDPNGFLHDSFTGFGARFFNRKVRTWTM